MTTNASPGATAAPAKEHPSHRGRDAREGAHNDDRTETANNPPNHGKATHGLARVVECIAERRCPECDGELRAAGNSSLACVDCDAIYQVGGLP